MTVRLLAAQALKLRLPILCITAALLALVLQAQDAGDTPAVSRPHLSNDQLRERDAWFYGIRSYPLAHTPPGARERALSQAQLLGQEKLTMDAASAAQPVPWKEIGPQPYQDSLNYSGRATAIAVDPRNNGTLYLGTAGGGVWKSLDSGLHWTPISDHEPSLATGAIAIDPNRPTTIYVGTGEANSSIDSYSGAGVIKTTDGGRTWEHLPFHFPTYGYGNVFGALAVSPASESILLAGHGTGIWRSADAGQTWSQVISGTTGYSAFFDKSHPNVAYAALGGIFGDPANGVYRSTDGGMTWKRLTGTKAHPFPAANLGRINLIEDPTRAGTLYASVSNCCAPFGAVIGIFKSVDGGANWTQLTDPGDCCDWYRNALAVSPAEPNVLLVGGADLWRSLDGGATWTDIAKQSNGGHADQHSIAFTPDGKKMYVANDGGVFSSSTYRNAIYSFNDLNATLATITFYPGVAVDHANLNHTVAGTQDNGLEQYSGKLAWTPSNGFYCGDGGQAAFDQKNTNYALSTCEGGVFTLTRSTDGGRTNAGWQSAENGINASEPHGWAPPVVFDPENEFAYYGTDHMYQSRDHGASWAEVSGPLTGQTISAITVAPSDEQVVYAGASDGSLQVTENALAGTGAAWRLINQGLPNAYITSITVATKNPKSVWVTLGGSGSGHVFHSITGGSAWTDISGNLPQITASRISLDPDFPATRYVATDVGVFSSTNAGGTWAPYGAGLPHVVVQDISINEATRTLVAVTHGRSAWTAPLPRLALSLSRSSIVLGNVLVGHTSALHTMTLYNPASAALAIASIKITGANPRDFRDKTTCGQSLAAHAKCTISVYFSPTAKGLRNGAISIYDQSSSEPQTVSLRGTGT